MATFTVCAELYSYLQELSMCFLFTKFVVSGVLSKNILILETE